MTVAREGSSSWMTTSGVSFIDHPVLGSPTDRHPPALPRPSERDRRGCQRGRSGSLRDPGTCRRPPCVGSDHGRIADGLGGGLDGIRGRVVDRDRLDDHRLPVTSLTVSIALVATSATIPGCPGRDDRCELLGHGVLPREAVDLAHDRAGAFQLRPRPPGSRAEDGPIAAPAMAPHARPCRVVWSVSVWMWTLPS